MQVELIGTGVPAMYLIPVGGGNVGQVLQLQGAALDDLRAAGANTARDQVLVGTAAGTLSWVAGQTAREAIAVFDTSADMEADSRSYSNLTAGDIIRAGVMTYEVAAAGASDHHVTNAAGVKFYETGNLYSARTRFAQAKTRGATWAAGEIVRTPDCDYVAVSGSTEISDLAGFEPHGREVRPGHYATNTTPFTTDMTAAVQAAYDFVAARTDRELVIAGGHRVTETINLDTAGVIVRGVGKHSTAKSVILADHTDGPGVRISADRIAMRDLRVKGGTTRSATAQDYENPGILIMPPDTPGALISQIELTNLLVDDHNGSEVVIYQATGVTLTNVYGTDCRRFGLVVGNSDEVNRVNKDNYTGQVVEIECRFNADWASRVVGAPSGVSQGGSVYRYVCISGDSTGGPKNSATITGNIPACGAWIRASNTTIMNSAFNPGDSGEAALILSGQYVTVKTNRFLDCGSSTHAIKVVNWDSNANKDIRLEQNEVEGTLPSSAMIKLDTTTSGTYDAVDPSEIIIIEPAYSGTVTNDFTGIRMYMDGTRTVMNTDFALSGKIDIGSYNASNTDITALVAGTAGGSLIEGQENGHLVLGIRGNGATDSLAIVGYDDAGGTYDNLAAQFFANGTSQFGGAVTFDGNASISGMLILPRSGFTAISGGVASITQSRVALTGEGGVADDLDTLLVNGATPPDGAIAYLTAGDSDVTITIKNATGNIRCGSDIVLDHAADAVQLMYDAVPGYWKRLGSGDNAT